MKGVRFSQERGFYMGEWPVEDERTGESFEEWCSRVGFEKHEGDGGEFFNVEVWEGKQGWMLCFNTYCRCYPIFVDDEAEMFAARVKLAVLPIAETLERLVERVEKLSGRC